MSDLRNSCNLSKRNSYRCISEMGHSLQTHSAPVPINVRYASDSDQIRHGFEMIYRARQRQWILHINMFFLGGKQSSLDKFEKSFDNSNIVKPVVSALLQDPSQQLSYVLKFSTYHRPLRQRGAKKGSAKSLNSREHCALVEWMSDRKFVDFLFLFNARREGPKIVLTDDV